MNICFQNCLFYFLFKNNNANYWSSHPSSSLIMERKILLLFFCTYLSCIILVATTTPQIRVRSHQLIKILTGDSYTYEFCIWHSIDLYPMLQNYCVFKQSYVGNLDLAGPILSFWKKCVFGNVWHCTKTKSV